MALIGMLRTPGLTGAYFVFCKMMKGKMMKRAMILPPMILQEQAASDLRNSPIKAAQHGTLVAQFLQAG
jgi:hypothetical protein